jgi:hypothetical protein
MTLGCGSWGGNVTSDNVSPLHLMDIKRVAFETRPVQSKRPAAAAQPTAMTSPLPAAKKSAPVAATASPAATPKVSREEIAAIVDRFLANRPETTPTPLPSPPPRVEVPTPPRPANGGNAAGAAEPSRNGRQAADFVSEDDVKRAIQKGEKIYVGPKTIITPSARDIGDPAEVFAKA